MKVTKADLLRTAAEVFAEHGYDGSTIAEVASRAGVSKAAVLYHFSNKEALLISLVTPIVDATETHLQRYPNPLPTLDERIEFLRGVMQVAISNADAARVLETNRLLWGHPALSKRVAQHHARILELLSAESAAPDAPARAAIALTTIFRWTVLGLDFAAGPIMSVDSAEARLVFLICRDILGPN